MEITVEPHERAAGGTVGTFLEEWAAHMRGRVRPKTLDGYLGLIRLYATPAIGHLALELLGPLHLQRLYSDLLLPERGLSGGTVLNLHLVLTQALGQAERWGLIPRNPAAGAQPPRPHRPEHHVVDAALAGRLLAVTEDTRFQLPVALAISTGMRRGEILALRWSDIDEDLGVAHVRRTLQTAGGELLFAEPKTGAHGGRSSCPHSCGPTWSASARSRSNGQRRALRGPSTTSWSTGATAPR